MTRSPVRPAGRRLLPALLALVALLVTGCVSLPVSGPVRAGPSVPAGTDEAPYDFNPAGPPTGGPAVDIVDGFLLAMQATPQSTVVARQFLTPESRADWSPDSGTLIYGSRPAYTTAGPGAVTVHLEDTARARRSRAGGSERPRAGSPSTCTWSRRTASGGSAIHRTR